MMPNLIMIHFSIEILTTTKPNGTKQNSKKKNKVKHAEDKVQLDQMALPHFQLTGKYFVRISTI